MHKNNSEISIIICTFNTKEMTVNCLSALKKSVDYLNKNVEVIVVENGTDGTDKEIINKFPLVKVVNPGTNTGFAKGNNIGIKNTDASSKYILLLNSDVLVKEETLKKSEEFMEQNNEADVLGCRLNIQDGRMQPSAGFVPTLFNIITWISGIDLIPGINRLIPQYHPKYKSFFAKTKKVGWVMGAYFFARREVLIETKGFDENLFMYLEEVDLCKRINDLGMQVWYTPDFFVTHYDKGSQMGDSSNAIKKEIEGIIYYIKKYYPNNLVFIKSLIKISVYLRMVAFKLVANNKRVEPYKEALQISLKS